MLNSDRVTFLVGAKLNEAHLDPTMPVEIESRRSLIKRIAALLEEKYMKQTVVRYLYRTEAVPHSPYGKIKTSAGRHPLRGIENGDRGMNNEQCV
jgi:hypothetical protein